MLLARKSLNCKSVAKSKYLYNKKQKCIQPITITLLAFSEFVKKPHRLRISTCLPLENARWF